MLKYLSFTNLSTFFKQYFIKKFEKAKEEDNEVFLTSVQKVHRKARLILDRPGMKDKIKQCIQDRSAAAKRKMYFKAFFAIAKFFEVYGFDDPIGAIFSRTLADIATPANFLALGPPPPFGGNVSLG